VGRVSVSGAKLTDQPEGEFCVGAEPRSFEGAALRFGSRPLLVMIPDAGHSERSERKMRRALGRPDRHRCSSR
jgi:hypothetical protein